MANWRVPLSRPSIGPQELEAVQTVLESGWLAHGEYNVKFEQEFARRVGVPEAVSLNSCTSALELALQVLGIRGEVVVPSMTFVATANAVVTTGGTPVFCDVDPQTRNMTAQTIEAVLTPRTEAVIVVHFAGQACAMGDIEALCRRRDLALIEDCAQALGAAWQEKPVGSFGLGCFSFFPTKNITTGEGGMLTCRTSEQARRARVLASHGITSSTMERATSERPWYRVAETAGHNYRLAHPLAALGYRQFLRLDELNGRRQMWARRYDDALGARAPLVRIPAIKPRATHVYQMYAVEVPPERRDPAIHELRRRGIEASVHFDPPVHQHPCYQAQAHPPLPATERLANTMITLPLFPAMTEEQHAWVVQSLAEICREIAAV